MENIDFTVVPEEAWNSLVQWYTLTEGQVRNISVLQFMISEDETFYHFDCKITLEFYGIYRKIVFFIGIHNINF